MRVVERHPTFDFGIWVRWYLAHQNLLTQQLSEMVQAAAALRARSATGVLQFIDVPSNERWCDVANLTPSSRHPLTELVTGIQTSANPVVRIALLDEPASEMLQVRAKQPRSQALENEAAGEILIQHECLLLVSHSGNEEGNSGVGLCRVELSGDHRRDWGN
jgi:hypothetical protein